MKFKSLIFKVLILLLVMSSTENGFAQRNTVGREFYVGFMDNNRRNTQPDKAIIIITANEKAAGIISTPKQSIPFSLEAGQQLIKEFDGNDEGLIHRQSGEVSYRRLKITSSGDLVVHAVNGREYSSDGTVVLPVTSLGKEYLATAHFDVFGPGQDPGSNENFESTLLVMAIENDTQIEITPSAPTVNTIPAGSTIRITLNEGESYQVKANGDLTGSRVKVVNSDLTDCKVVAVFGGNKTTSAGTCGTSGDHMFQQAYPLESWGKSFIHIPLEGRTSGEIVKVLASQNGTSVRVNGQTVGTLNAGKFLKLEFGKNEVASIETSKPSTVAVIAKSAACNEFGVAPLGDPSIFTLSPNNQRLKSITFSAGKLIGSFNQDIVHYLEIIVPKGTGDQTLVNGIPVGYAFAEVPGADFEFARVTINKGVNSVSNPEGFLGYAYGSGSIESYAFAIGSSLESIQYETETTYDFEVEGEKVACLDQEGLWKIIPDDPKFSIFTWDFGDNSAAQSGQEVAHTFTSEGTFEVSVLASSGDGKCGSEQTFTFEVKVEKVGATLIGPTSVCPDSDEFTYTLEDRTNFETAIWTVDGGQVISETDSTITIKWGAANPAAKVQAIPVAPNGCYGAVLELEIEITDTIQPEKPAGQQGICGVQTDPLSYKVNFPSAGKVYTWSVFGGELISGQGTTEVLVLWDVLETDRRIFFEEASASNAACFGVSEVLEVGSFDPAVLGVDEEINPSCPGESDGSIKLNITGGSGDFKFNWSHDPLLNEDEALGLSAGIYEVELIDLSGCGIEKLAIEIIDPQPISIALASLTYPYCFGESSGEIALNISGGTAPFLVIGQNSTWANGVLTITDLPAGEIELEIQDSRGCIASFSETLISPEPLELRFVQESPGCPGDLSGALTVIPNGGNPPYNFLWETGGSFATLEQLSSGNYSVIVTDSNGCEVRGKGIVSKAVPQVRMPTGFIPGDGNYIPISSCPITYKMMIYDRWGQLVHSGSEGWDGLFQGTEMLQGVYSFKLEYEYNTDAGIVVDDKMGSFTLIR
ncbi:PKD domain-containing protein [Algoriphagus marinus]|uniref:PKD domain-containing protein n=1 Tax=Algoriphagus marinus TaxID=1925762 RepID=UPI00094BA9E0|nr:PKD domain-containing protein [Algoriphagus marinus]